MDLILGGSRSLEHLGCALRRMTWGSPGSTLHLRAPSDLSRRSLLYEREPSVWGLARGGGFGLRWRLPATPHLAGWPGSPGLGYFLFQLGHA